MRVYNIIAVPKSVGANGHFRHFRSLEQQSSVILFCSDYLYSRNCTIVELLPVKDSKQQEEELHWLSTEHVAQRRSASVTLKILFRRM